MISPNNYIAIACLLEKASIIQQNEIDQLNSMEINLNKVYSTNNDNLLTEIDNLKNKISTYQTQPYNNLINAVTQLQAHVKRYYGDVNSFLSVNNIIVSPYFAMLSTSCGVVINSGNIGSPCSE